MTRIRVSLLMPIFSVIIRASLADGTTDINLDPAATTTISKAGSYRLVSDVTMTANVVAININALDVTLDLNGHTITGAPGSTFPAIAGNNNLTLLNGNIRDFGGYGVETVDNSIIRNVSVIGCNKAGGAGGISVFRDSTVEGCLVRSIAPTGSGSSTGISAFGGCRVVDNVVAMISSPDDTAYGINAGEGCLVENNVIRSVGVLGGSAPVYGVTGVRSTIRGNTILYCQTLGTGAGYGIDASDGSLIEANVSTGHATSGANPVIGIRATNSTVRNNICRSNSAGPGGNGIGIGVFNCSVQGNRCEANNGAGGGYSAGILSSGASQIENNSCASNAGPVQGWGIRVEGSGNLVANNAVSFNSTAGILFTVATNNRAHSNQLRQGLGIDTTNGVNPASLGTGDLANIFY